MNRNKKTILGCLLAIAVLCTVLIIKGIGGSDNSSTEVVESKEISQSGIVSAVQNEETRAAISSSGPREAAVSSAAIRKKEDAKKRESAIENNDHKKEPKSTKKPDKKEDKSADREADNKIDKKTEKKTADLLSARTKSPKKNTGSQPKPQSTKNPGKNTQAAVPAPTQPPVAAGATKQEKKECSLTITCQEVFSHMDKLSDSAKKVIPKDGMILNGTFAFEEGETVFDLLKRVCKEKEIHQIGRAHV